MSPNPLRKIPSVGELLDSPPLRKVLDRLSHNVVVSTARTVLDELRTEVQTAATEKTLPSVADLAERIAQRILEGELHALRPVINATGILLHGELGRAPLAEEAVEEVAAVARDYASLELDFTSGRPSRRTTAVEELLRELTGAEAATVVNNNAGATMLTLSALAAGREVVVSRGQLIEIGGDCHLPKLMAASGAVLREVGTANKTRLDEYAEVICDETAALILVHSSDFIVAGSSASVGIEELAELGRRHKVPVIHDIGSGTMLDVGQFGVDDEPVVAQSIKAGADLALFSGDKLLGGPQCGVIVGRRDLVDRLERHPMARALRVGKLTLAALAATLRLHHDPQQARCTIPLLCLLTTSVENLQSRAERLAPQMAATGIVAEAEVVTETTCLWGGDVPNRQLPTRCVALKPAGMSVDRLATLLRTSTPSIVGRVQPDCLMLDLRSVLPRQDLQMVAVLEALDSGKH